MSNPKGKGGLGKGLSALIPQEPDVALENGETSEIPIVKITTNPYQPRREFDPEKLAELTESIKRHGVVQPVLLRKTDEGGYQLVAGERRLRASQAAGLTTIPAVVKTYSDDEMMEIALIENIQREDLNPVEEAIAYKKLSEEFGLTQEQIAKRVSKSRSFIANSMRLLNLSTKILNQLAQGKLTTGHVRPLLTLPQEEAERLANIMVEQKATVREAEAWVHAASEPAVPGQVPANANLPEMPQEILTGQITASKEKMAQENKSDSAQSTMPVELKEIERVLRERINTKVEVVQSAKGGKIIIEYYHQDDLDRILTLFTGYGEID